MISLKKNKEMFWFFEVLFLTPLAIFWMGVLILMLGKSENILRAVVGQPLDPIRSTVIVIVCPFFASWLAWQYTKENKKDKSTTIKYAKYIMAVGVVSIILVLLYLYGPNSS